MKGSSSGQSQRLDVAALRALSSVRDALHRPPAPRWMRHVLATGVGPKIVAGKQTSALAIHCVVAKKLPTAALADAERIPKSFAGHPTDVVDSSRGERPLPEPPEPLQLAPSRCGYGTPLLTESGAWGTAACAGRTAAGQALLVTSAHVVGLDEAVYEGSADPPVLLGRCSQRLPTADRHDLYGERGSAVDGRYLVDVAILALAAGVTPASERDGWKSQPCARGLDTARIDEWLFTSTPLFAWGAASRVWRRGAVAFYWPRRTEDDLYGLCLVQQEPQSEPGDSGSLWLARVGGTWKPVGLHWGLSTDSRSVMSFVTDGVAALHRLGVEELLLPP